MCSVDRWIRSISSLHVKAIISVVKIEKKIFIYCFSDAENDIMHVNVPITKPSGYNASSNPVTVKLNLDPNCRYQIT